jgi:CheY-like chemotaxis protein
MRKRILLAEESDTIRGVAESVLRQNGFEVIAVTSGAKALEVLNFTRPDLLIAGSDLSGPGNKPLYEIIQADPRIASLPLLILCNNNEAGLPFPEEVLVPRPFDPKDFIVKVNTFSGGANPSVSAQPAKNPLGDAGIDDALLDAALGMDDINVTDSEVMDRTNMGLKVPKKRHADQMIGYEHVEDETDTGSDSGRVESLMIHEDTTDIKHSPAKDKPKVNLSGSSKLEILSDQYGLEESEGSDSESEGRVHDYDWFVNEMQNESKGKTGGTTKVKTAKQPEGNLSFTDPSSMVDPVTPGPKQAPKKSEAGPAVDKFIDEFKKEIEKIHSTEPESITLNAEPAARKEGESLDWEDTLEHLTPEKVEMFAQQFIAELAERLADKIAAKIDSEKLLALLKTEMFKHLEKKHR